MAEDGHMLADCFSMLDFFKQLVDYQFEKYFTYCK